MVLSSDTLGLAGGRALDMIPAVADHMSVPVMELYAINRLSEPNSRMPCEPYSALQ